MSETNWGRRKYRTTNWKAYNAALKAQGYLTICLDLDMQWLAIWERWGGYRRRSLVKTEMN